MKQPCNDAWTQHRSADPWRRKLWAHLTTGFGSAAVDGASAPGGVADGGAPAEAFGEVFVAFAARRAPPSRAPEGFLAAGNGVCTGCSERGRAAILPQPNARHNVRAANGSPNTSALTSTAWTQPFKLYLCKAKP